MRVLFARDKTNSLHMQQSSDAILSGISEAKFDTFKTHSHVNHEKVLILDSRQPPARELQALIKKRFLELFRENFLSELCADIGNLSLNRRHAEIHATGSRQFTAN